MEVRAPKTDSEWEQYFRLRYEVLRAPWNQPLGSEKNDGDITAEHFAVFEGGKILSVGRLDEGLNTSSQQVRFVAVHPKVQGRGVGKLLMKAIERRVSEKGIHEVILHARENAVPFYQSIGYQIVGPSHVLFGEIQHFLMRKYLIRLSDSI